MRLLGLVKRGVRGVETVGMGRMAEPGRQRATSVGIAVVAVALLLRLWNL